MHLTNALTTLIINDYKTSINDVLKKVYCHSSMLMAMENL